MLILVRLLQLESIVSDVESLSRLLGVEVQLLNCIFHLSHLLGLVVIIIIIIYINFLVVVVGLHLVLFRVVVVLSGHVDLRIKLGDVVVVQGLVLDGLLSEALGILKKRLG